MGNGVLRALAEDIAHGLVREMRRPSLSAAPRSASVVDLLQELADRLSVLLSELGTDQSLSDKKQEAIPQRADTKLGRLTVGHPDEDEDEIDDAGSRFPNLKYAKPKYKNVESILKYIEREDDKGGVKLVIMNFND